jgi:hypothetical protein
MPRQPNGDHRAGRGGFAASAALVGIVLATGRAGAQPVAATQPLPSDSATAQFTAKQVFQYDSNPLLEALQPTDLWGFVTSPELTLNDSTPVTQLSLDILGNINRFNQSTLDSDDAHIKGTGTYTWDRWTAGVTGTFDYDTARTAEATASAFLTAEHHTGYSVDPTGTYQLGERDQLQLSGGVARSYYVGDAYTDYRVYSANPAYLHSFDSLNSGYVAVELSRYQSTSGVLVNIDQVAPVIGWNTELGDNWYLSTMAGPERLYFSYVANIGQPGAITNSATYNVDLMFKGQQDTFHLKVNRQPVPTGEANEADTTSLTLVGRHYVTPHFELDLSVLYQQSTYPANIALTSKYLVNANPSLVYHLNDQLSATVGYMWREREYVNFNAPATSNAATLTFTYTPQLWAVR